MKLVCTEEGATMGFVSAPIVNCTLHKDLLFQHFALCITIDPLHTHTHHLSSHVCVCVCVPAQTHTT